MSSIKRHFDLQIPERMRSKLESFQRRVWVIKLAEGLLAAAFGLLVSYLLVFGLDRFVVERIHHRTDECGRGQGGGEPDNNPAKLHGSSLCRSSVVARLPRYEWLGYRFARSGDRFSFAVRDRFDPRGL